MTNTTHITEEVYNQLNDTEKAGYKPDKQWRHLHCNWRSYSEYQPDEIAIKVGIIERLVYIPINPTPEIKGQNTLQKINQVIDFVMGFENANKFYRKDVIKVAISVLELIDRKSTINPTRDKEPEEIPMIEKLTHRIDKMQREFDENGYDLPLDIKLQRIEQHVYGAIENNKKIAITQTLNAVRGIIEAEIPLYYNSLQSWQDANPMHLKHRILTEINKL